MDKDMGSSMSGTKVLSPGSTFSESYGIVPSPEKRRAKTPTTEHLDMYLQCRLDQLEYCACAFASTLFRLGNLLRLPPTMPTSMR